MKLVTWVKTSGAEISLNDLPSTEAQAEMLGWKKKTKRKAKNVDSSDDSKRGSSLTKPE